MREICLPLPILKDDEIVEIILTTSKSGKKEEYKYEAFPWDVPDELSECRDETSLSLARISRLKKSIESYDKSWELIQIFAPLERSKVIRVLYRKRK
ncbi:MAG: hypothetical protein U0W24_03325 [Bacteroidales bacterium]